MTSRRCVWASIIATTIATTVGCKDKSQTPPSPPLDQRLGADEARAGPMTAASELIGDKGRLGDFKIYNNRVAFTIAAPGSVRGFHPYGGIVLDADVVREPGEPGRSVFGEVIAALDLAVLQPDRIEVLDTGAARTAARIRVSGAQGRFPFLSAALGSLLRFEQTPVEWSVDYILEPGARHLTIERAIRNPGATTIEFGLPVAALFFGTGAVPFVEERGFSPSQSGFTAPYYAAASADVAYLYGRPGSDLSILFGESGIVVGAFGDTAPLRARDTLMFSDVLIVDRQLADARDAWRIHTSAGPGTTVSGSVTDAGGAAVGGARIHVELAGEAHYLTRTTASSSGEFSLNLEPGAYTFTAVTDERLVSDAVRVDVGATPPPAVSLAVPEVGRARVIVTDAADRALPFKLTVEGTQDVQIPTSYGERHHAEDAFRTEFFETGEGLLSLPAGPYTLYLSRGAEYEVVQVDIIVQAGALMDIDRVLRRTVDTAGWMSTDVHVHAQLSPDSPDSFEFKARALAAQNIELPVSTDHEAIGDFNPAIKALGLTPWLRGVVGTEVSTTRYGHFNAFPLVARPDEPGNGRITTWYTEPAAATLAAIRALGDPFIQVNHPRLGGIGYFEVIEFDRQTMTAGWAEQFSNDFDGFEVIRDCMPGALESPAVLDWFAFLSAGQRKVGTGSPDDHIAGQGGLGYPLVYVRMPTDDPAEARDSDFRRAFGQGELSVSCGPFVDLSIGDAGVGGLASITDARVTAQVRVSAPTWMDVDTVSLIVNGRTVATASTAPSGDAVRFDDTLTATLTPGQDAWALVWAQGDTPHGVWAKGKMSFGFTNPVFIDGDGDGRWRDGR